MSLQELKVLNTDSCFKTRSGKVTRPEMTELAALEQVVKELRVQLSHLQEELCKKDQEIEKLESVAQRATAKEAEAREVASLEAEGVARLKQELENCG